MQKDHLEILLADVSSKFSLVLEGHAALDKKIDDRFDMLNEKIEHNSFLINVVNEKVDKIDDRLSNLEVKVDVIEVRLGKLQVKVEAIAADISEHRADTEAHHGIYRVKEGCQVDVSQL